jgi:hypothetical protein
MARLDAEAASAAVRPSRVPTAAEAWAYLESLPELWAKTSDAGRPSIAETVFERIDVLGVTDFTFTLTPHAKARGWDAAFGAGVDLVGARGLDRRSTALRIGDESDAAPVLGPAVLKLETAALADEAGPTVLVFAKDAFALARCFGGKQFDGYGRRFRVAETRGSPRLPRSGVDRPQIAECLASDVYARLTDVRAVAGHQVVLGVAAERAPLDEGRAFPGLGHR